MKIVKIKGGLGNQLFQYCFAYLMSKRTGQEIKLDLSEYDCNAADGIRVPRILKMKTSLAVADSNDIKSICHLRHDGNALTNLYRAKVLLEYVTNKDYYFEKTRAYVDPASIEKYRYFDGYWQSWRYVDPVWDEIKTELEPNYQLSEATASKIKAMASDNYVAVGIRRGDYTKSQHHYGSFGNDYYQKAMDYIESHTENAVFCVFSNDIDWAKNNIDFSGRRVVFREPEDVTDDFEELFIMAACRHSIIANSTYHWWGARLGDNPGKIAVAPGKWFFDNKPIDIVPPHWIKL